VVKSRLEVAGLGEFLLPLQAERSTREQVIESIRERMEMPGSPKARDYDIKIEEYRTTRDQIAKYIDLMMRAFRETGFTIREILGKSVALETALKGIPTYALDACKIPPSVLSASGLKELRETGTRISDAHREAAI